MAHYTANVKLYWDGTSVNTSRGVLAYGAGDTVPDAEVTRSGLATAGLVTSQPDGGTPTPFTPLSREQANGTYVQAAVVAASGDTSGATDTAAIQAAHDGLPAAGGRIHLPAGAFYLNAAVTFTKPVTLTGAGGALTGDASQSPPAALTTVYVASQTADAFVIGADGSTVMDLAIVNTASSAPTAGAGLHVTKGEFTRIERVSVVKFWNCVQFDDGFYYAIAHSTFLDPVNYGLYLTNSTSGEGDHGDQSVIGCTLTYFYTTRAGGTAIRWESGGGLRVTSCKINGGTQPGNSSAGQFAYGVDLAPADGVNTSVFPITGNSIENCSTALIRLRQKGPSNTGIIGKVNISGNELFNSPRALFIDSQSLANGPQGIVFAGNTVTSISSRGVEGQNCQLLTVGTNEWHSISNNAYLVYNGPNSLSLQMSPQNCANYPVCHLHDEIPDNTAASNPSQGSHPGTWKREMPSITSKVTYTTLFRVQLPQYTDLILTLTMGLNPRGVGNGSAIYKRRFRRVTTTAAAATIGTDWVDYNGTAGTLDVNFDVTSASGYVDVQVKLNSAATATDVNGSAVLQIDTAPREVWRMS